MRKTKKSLLIVFLICFLLNSTALYAADLSPVDSFLTRKTQVVKQWMGDFEKSFAHFQSRLKESSGDFFKDFFKDGDYWSKMKKSFDEMIEGQRDKIEDFRKDYDKAVGIREM